MKNDQLTDDLIQNEIAYQKMLGTLSITHVSKSDKHGTDIKDRKIISDPENDDSEISGETDVTWLS